MAATFYLGVDGGGTRCRARLETADGQVLGRGLAGPASMRFGLDAATGSIMAATRQALSEVGWRTPPAGASDSFAPMAGWPIECGTEALMPPTPWPAGG